MDQSAAQRAEIGKLTEKVQRAIASGQVVFSPELDRRIREAVRQ